VNSLQGRLQNSAFWTSAECHSSRNVLIGYLPVYYPMNRTSGAIKESSESLHSSGSCLVGFNDCLGFFVRKLSSGSSLSSFLESIIPENFVIWLVQSCTPSMTDVFLMCDVFKIFIRIVGFISVLVIDSHALWSRSYETFRHERVNGLPVFPPFIIKQLCDAIAMTPWIYLEFSKSKYAPIGTDKVVPSERGQLRISDMFMVVHGMRIAHHACI
jgi:hypothetical protein